uniref:HTH cro/C1-type domain-containing protein n=1 Tax=viral metagenome TaxID=1070528 RepID=A0A6M3JRW9_9ZZZZ
MKKKPTKQIRKLLRLKIVEHFDNQGRFALAAEIDEAIVSKLINCYRDPTADQSKLFSKLLNTPADILFAK